MTTEQLKQFLKDAPEEYVKVYEPRFKAIARKAFLDGIMVMSHFVDKDGDYYFEWDSSNFLEIKLANDIANDIAFADAEGKKKELTLNQYQQLAMQTCMPSSDNFAYMMLNLMGEVGEFASKVAKDIRKENVTIGDIVNDLTPTIPIDAWFDRSEELEKEAGDILWQLAGLCHVMGWKLNSVGLKNISKLQSRQQRGKIDGEGDNR